MFYTWHFTSQQLFTLHSNSIVCMHVHVHQRVCQKVVEKSKKATYKERRENFSLVSTFQLDIFNRPEGREKFHNINVYYMYVHYIHM
jgi:hypothetical protein